MRVEVVGVESAHVGAEIFNILGVPQRKRQVVAAVEQDGIAVAADAVSYTHLDVYKRQDIPLSNARCPGSRFLHLPTRQTIRMKL